MRWLSRVVSGIVIVAVVAGAALLFRTKLPTTKVGQRFVTFALFRDGSKLALGSPVMIAGVRVGEVTQLSVESGFARVDLVLRDNADIPIDSWVTKRADTPFGDSYIEIIPTGNDEGAPTARRLRSGEQLIHVLDGGSTDSTLRAIAATMPKIDRGLEAVHDFALEGRRWTSGTLEEALVGADRWIAEGHIDQPIASADRALERIERGTTSAADAVASAKPDVSRTLDRFDRGLTNARTQMAELKTDLRDGFAGARKGMDRIDPTADQLRDVMEAVNEGRGDDFKGRLGRLVNDPELANTIEDVTETVRDATGGLDRFRSWLGFRFEVDYFSKSPRVYVTAEIRARNDKFYLIEFERGPLGNLPSDELIDSAGVPQYKRAQQIRDAYRFTAEFGKRLGWLQIRGGLKESTMGLGADLLVDHGRLRLSADLFGSYQRTPRLKLAGALEVFRSFYVLAGVDDVFNRPGYLNLVKGNTNVPTQFDSVRYGRDYFFGATLQFTDADLAMLLRIYGALIIGLL